MEQNVCFVVWDTIPYLTRVLVYITMEAVDLEICLEGFLMPSTVELHTACSLINRQNTAP